MGLVNSTRLYGVRQAGVENPTVSLVEIDRGAQAFKVLLTLNVTGFVRAAYYAWTHDHFCVVVAGRGEAAQDTMVFIDTRAASVHKQSLVQAGVTLRAMAINYATRNVYALCRSRADGSLSFAIVHMDGMVQEVLASLPDTIHAPAFAPAVVDNEANLFHVYVRSGVDPPLEGMVATFDLSAAPITVSMAPLPGGTGALAVRAAQWQ